MKMKRRERRHGRVATAKNERKRKDEEREQPATSADKWHVTRNEMVDEYRQRISGWRRTERRRERTTP